MFPASRIKGTTGKYYRGVNIENVIVASSVHPYSDLDMYKLR